MLKYTCGCKSFHFHPKMLQPVSVLQPVLHCEKPLLGGILVLCQDEFGRGKETSGQGTPRHFPGRVTKAALLDLQQGKHINVCEGSLGTVQNAVWTYSSVCRISRLIMAKATCYTRFNSEEGTAPACYKSGIDGFLCEHVIKMINGPINRSIWALVRGQVKCNCTHWNIWRCFAFCWLGIPQRTQRNQSPH